MKWSKYIWSDTYSEHKKFQKEVEEKTQGDCESP